MKNTQETVMRKRPKSHQSMLEFICLLKEIRDSSGEAWFHFPSSPLGLEPALGSKGNNLNSIDLDLHCLNQSGFILHKSNKACSLPEPGWFLLPLCNRGKWPFSFLFHGQFQFPV